MFMSTLKGNYKESSPVKPPNNYAWSKLGGECAVQMYKNSLIPRLSITERPFNYKIAYTNIKVVLFIIRRHLQ